MPDSHLLPPSSTDLERAIAKTTAASTALPVRISDVRNPSRCPAPLLPFLAWEMSVDEWNPLWGEDVNRKKGTRGAVRRALEAIFGPDGFTLIEGAWAGLHDGTKQHNGLFFYGREINWARYSVLITRPITLQQAASVRRILAAVAPARCHLLALNFTQALNAYDGAITYNNTYTHGVA